MERFWPDESIEFEASIRGALRRAGAVDAARACEADPSQRAATIGRVMEALEVESLDVSGELPVAASAALAARAAGEVACPWPVVQRLAVPQSLRDTIDAVDLYDHRPPRRLAHLDLFTMPAAFDIRTGVLRRVHAVGPLEQMPLDPFGVPCELGEELIAVDGIMERHIVLAGFWAHGALSTARTLATEHARDRHQFGRPISQFGAIQWHLSDIAGACDGLGELAAFSLLRVAEGRLSTADALALRLATQDAAKVVLHAAHQILAAVGLCEEHDLAVLDRHLQSIVHRPCNVGVTLALLTQAIAQEGFDAIYPIPGASVAAGNARPGGEVAMRVFAQGAKPAAE
jgi:acyl-CoA dehydrogenase